VLLIIQVDRTLVFNEANKQIKDSWLQFLLTYAIFESSENL
jgi:hypothetical protein